ncbi:MAG: hypothetical protein JW776_04305 [Candidatus Lokiarchaeota archaeon]|nr:hypothetical protein [Candidatus Lokiarchaeota archaeon]
MLWIAVIVFIVFVAFIATGIVLFRELVCKRKQITRGLCKNFKFPNAKHPKWKKFGAIVLIVLLSGIIGEGLWMASNRLSYIRFDITGYAEWREDNTMPYLYVESDNPYDMGYLVGQEIAWKIYYMKLYLVGTGFFYGFSYPKFKKVAATYEQYIPEDHLEELRGLADGASQKTGFHISYTDALAQHVFTEATYGFFEPRGCTVIGSNNTDGSVTIGQNWDFSDAFKPTMVWVHANLTGKQETFSLRGGACLSLICGKNENGFSLFSSLVSINQPADPMMPLSSITKLALETSATLEEMYNIIYASPVSSYGYSMMFGNSTDFFASQHIPSQYIFNTSDEVVFTNTYTIETWQQYLLDLDYSWNRQIYVEYMVDSNRSDGILTQNELCAILGDQPIVGRSGESLFSSSTCAYFTGERFGMGIYKDLIFGICPI